MRGILVAFVIALAFAGAAQAATIHDLQSLGYTVKVVSQSQNCKLWVASGFGITEKLGCDGTSGFQANVDAMADPETACDVKWQFNHHDQRSAVSQIDQLGYVVTADECAGKYTVTNRFTKASVYKGAGVGLVALAAKIRPAAPKATSMPALVSTCLPLCQTVTPVTLQADTSGGKVSLAVTVTLADVLLALEKRDKASVEPLLSSALSSALGRKLVVTDNTACTIRDNPIECGRLYSLISDTQVTVTFNGTTATGVGLPVPKVKSNPAKN